MKTFKSKIEADGLDLDERDEALQDFDGMVGAVFDEVKTITARKQRARISWTVTVEEVPQ